MWIRDRIVHVYDVEIFPNCFHCCVKNTETGQLYKFEISERRNQLDELVDFFYYDLSDKYINNYLNYIVKFINK